MHAPHAEPSSLRYSAIAPQSPPHPHPPRPHLCAPPRSFTQKVLSAQQAGAKAALVVDYLPWLYITGSPPGAATSAVNFSTLAVPACNVDCRAGSGTVAVDALSIAALEAGIPGTCGTGCTGLGMTGGCALAPIDSLTPVGQRRTCCLVSDDMSMGYGANDPWVGDIVIPAAFLALPAASSLLRALNFTMPEPQVWRGGALPAAVAADTSVRIQARWTPVMDPAAGIIWALAVCAAVLAAWVSAAPEREKASVAAAPGGSGRSGPPRPAPPPMHAASITVSWQQGVMLVVGAATVLGLLFLLLKLGVSIALILIGIFSFAATTATTQVALLPAVYRALPRIAGNTVCRTVRCGGVHVTVGHAITVPVALGLVAVWVVFRHASWSWLLQDTFGVLVCCMFLSTLRLKSLRDATVILCGFFLYDIFMVFATVYLVGSSVMVDVATAGAPQEVPNWACHCRIFPSDTASCGPGEYMPILLRVPHVQDYRGGYAMLGLGDIVVPGLLLSLALRFDYATYAALPRGKMSCAYFAVTASGYGLGLMLANIAVSVMHMGQPALLYLVPCTLIPVALVARSRRQLDGMWTGRRVAPVDITGGSALGDHDGDDDSSNSGGHGAGGSGGAVTDAVVNVGAYGHGDDSARDAGLRSLNRVGVLGDTSSDDSDKDGNDEARRLVRGGDHSGLRGGRHGERVVELAPVPSGPDRGGSSSAGDQT